MKSEQIDKISSLVTPLLQPLNAYLVEVSIRGERGSSVVEIFTDTDEGITADQCGEISRRLSEELDAHNLFAGRYRLEVSSPGLDRPMKLSRQYVKNIGREMKIVAAAGGSAATVTGILQTATEDSLALLTSEKQTVVVAMKDVREAYVLPRIKKRM